MYSGDCIDGKIEAFYVCSLKEDNCPYKRYSGWNYYGNNEEKDLIINEDSNLENSCINKALNEWKAYQLVTKEILDESDYQTIKGLEI